MKSNKRIFYRCYYSFFVSGMTVLIIGSVLPLLIKEANLSYSLAGSLLSFLAIGNFFASFVVPPFYKRLGRKRSILILSSLIPIALIGLILLPPFFIMALLMLGFGIGRGAISNFSNSVVSDYSNGQPGALNILHTCFALGAFLSPFLMSLLMSKGFQWRQMLTLLVIFCVTSLISYGTIALDSKPLSSSEDTTDRQTTQKPITKPTYFKSFDFYCIGLILFFYLGMENCINGWFVTYLQSTGVMDGTYAGYLVSITWLAIMAGRLICAKLSDRVMKKRMILINCLGSMAAFLLLISTTNLMVITFAIALFGFTLAGIYPTCIANVSSLIMGSASGMAVIMGIAALGGIITPKIIGLIADRVGLVAAISFLMVDVIVMVVFALINNFRNTIQ